MKDMAGNKKWTQLMSFEEQVVSPAADSSKRSFAFKLRDYSSAKEEEDNLYTEYAN